MIYTDRLTSLPIGRSFYYLTAVALAVLQLATDEKVRLDDVRLYLDASEAAKEFVGHYFGKTLYFDYTHLVCRTALDGNS